MTPILDGSDGDFAPESFKDTDAEFDELGKTDAYPTEWQLVGDNLSDVCFRQLDAGTYQVKSTTHRIVLSTEGWNLFNDKTIQGNVIFTDWCKRNNIFPISIEDDIPVEKETHPVAVGKLLNGEG